MTQGMPSLSGHGFSTARLLQPVDVGFLGASVFAAILSQ